MSKCLCKQKLYSSPQPLDINVNENVWTPREAAVQKRKIRKKAYLKQVLLEEWVKYLPPKGQDMREQPDEELHFRGPFPRLRIVGKQRTSPKDNTGGAA
ncbi:hypothetical protein TNCV_3913291 [Trichonephila clavipes]|nr:hypothetical protein TNCV_3913291 [Trichonephila clavipes]